MSGCRPDLLAVDPVTVTLARGRRPQRSQVRSRCRLGKALAEPDVEIGELRQPLLLHGLRSESHEDRAEHRDVEGQRLRCRRPVELFLENDFLDDPQIAPAEPTRPMGGRPAASIQFRCHSTISERDGACPSRSFIRINWGSLASMKLRRIGETRLAPDSSRSRRVDLEVSLWPFSHQSRPVNLVRFFGNVRQERLTG